VFSQTYRRPFFADFFDRDPFDPDDLELLFEALCLRAGVLLGARDAD
jgi:hypothetical protein